MSSPSPISHLPSAVFTGARLLAAARTGGFAGILGLLGGVLGAHVLPPLPERVVLPPPVTVPDGYRLRPGETAMTLATLEAITAGHRARGRQEGVVQVLDTLPTLPIGITLAEIEQRLRAQFLEVQP